MFARNGLRGKATHVEAQPSLNSVRSWKRHQARARQESTIQELRQEVQWLRQSWLSGEYCWIPVHKALESRARDMIASLEVHRARCIEKGKHFHFARDASAGHGAEEQRLHQKANRGKHDVFIDEHMEIQRTGSTTPDWFSSFSLLDDMANDTTIVNAGATVIPSAAVETDHNLEPGDSLINQMRERQFADRILVSHVITCCADDSWKLQHGDIVCVGEDPRPSRVYRLGHGDFDGQVRVAWLDEDESIWQNGRWVGTDQCHKLEVGDRLMATSDIIDATDNRRLIPEGTISRFRGHDSDGDVLITIGGTKIKTVIFYEDLTKLSLE